VASPENLIRLDTGAFHAARAARLTRTALYWLLLVGAAVAVATVIGLVAAHTPSLADGPPNSAPRLTAAPAPTTTPVAVWNASGLPGAAGRLAARVQTLGYPIAGTRVARTRVHGRVVMFAPGAESAAIALAKHLKLDPRHAVLPLDGVPAADIAPATLLVLIGH
jgi:hypothetical protein